MGYNTDFVGSFEITNGSLSKAQIEYLTKFSTSRRVKRDPKLIPNNKLVETSRIAVGLPIGIEGEFVINEYMPYGIDRKYVIDDCKISCGRIYATKDESVIDDNHPPGSQPGLWCHWTCDESGTKILKNKLINFYDYTEWLEYLIDRFLKQWNLVLNGTVSFTCEDHEEYGEIIVKDNVVTVNRYDMNS